MRWRRRDYHDDGYMRYGRPEQYDDGFGSRSYRSSRAYEGGPYGVRYERGDEYPDDRDYYQEGRQYHSRRWYNDSEPYEEDLRDEYDRYGVGLSRGRYYGEPYGSTYRHRSTSRRGVEEAQRERPEWDDRRYRERREEDHERHGLFSRAGERIRDAWHHWRHRYAH